MTDAISSILSQIRAHELRTQGPLAGAAGMPGVGGLGGAGAAGDAAPSNAIGGVRPAGSDFQQTLNNAIDGVSRAQNDAGALQQAFELGDPRADLARVMVAMQQSQVAFKAAVEVRNRLVQAYQEVMNMPI
ncbi:flagellar hook-basal body complex protein FliE [Thermomonas sp. S9]|uniref:flagellar hook-basal body complex protein FliE n=1 Tax=Thermomonas sp. S9 TaxID=2885203 RepID=UPI00216ACE13|nr:flagellar hook-basal body complex protein FliE [Thermomonas sp. S9]MCR6496378.1 flagellar hook-basal body complex protein FliE [Thermomonas sp. S9]